MNPMMNGDGIREGHGRPIVSIGVPVFNAETTVRKALDSLLAQTYTNIEFYISDNASTDKSFSICESYVRKDPRIRLSRNESNLGIIANFKIVYANTSGRYFMWAASDDFWEPDYVGRMVGVLESDPGVGVALSAVRRAFPDGRIQDIVRYAKPNNPNCLSNLKVAVNLMSPSDRIKNLKFNLFICGLFRREALDGLFMLGDQVLGMGERAFLAPIALRYRFQFVDEVLFTKIIYDKSYKDRRPEDLYTQTKRGMGYLQYYKTVMNWILRSTMVPLSRKVFLVVMAGFCFQRMMQKLKKRMGRLFKTVNSRY